MALSKKIIPYDILSQECFTTVWLREKGFSISIKSLKLIKNRTLAMLLNFVTPTKATWNGHNASGWKEHFMAINGFNHEMGYGGEDREFGERLFNYGIRSRQIRYSAICLHLDHPRGYVTEETWKTNNAIRSTTKKEKAVRCTWGLNTLKKES